MNEINFGEARKNLKKKREKTLFKLKKKKTF